MERQNYAAGFKTIVEKLFELIEYDTSRSGTIHDQRFDLIAKKNDLSGIYIVDIKFYRSRTINSKLLEKLASGLAYSAEQVPNSTGIVVVNVLVEQPIRELLKTHYGIIFWDLEVLYSSIATLSTDLLEDFRTLLISAQEGSVIYDPFDVVQTPISDESKIRNNLAQISPKSGTAPNFEGGTLYEELRKIECGQKSWAEYERQCVKILKWLFNDDLKLWDQQLLTDDRLSRFDLICRITSSHDFWKSLASSFNTRLLLFEFKNYCEKIDQEQIYTTERYLYTRALRSVGIIIARKGGNDNAIAAAKGSLREHGKLILILSDNDLCKMLSMRDKNESPSDYLADIVDRWLISLSR